MLPSLSAPACKSAHNTGALIADFPALTLNPAQPRHVDCDSSCQAIQDIPGEDHSTFLRCLGLEIRFGHLQKIVSVHQTMK